MAKRSNSRPKAIIDWNKVDSLLIGGSNGVQVAAELGIHPDTLYRAVEREKHVTFAAYYNQKRAKGDSYIHQAQYQKALKEKNTTMLIWLGKQRCGQRDRDEESAKIPSQDAIVERDNENMSLKAQIAELREKIDYLTKTRQELPPSDPSL